MNKKVHSELLTEVEIIVIAVVCCLLLVACLVGLCKFLEIRRRKEVSQNSLREICRRYEGGWTREANLNHLKKKKETGNKKREKKSASLFP